MVEKKETSQKKKIGIDVPYPTESCEDKNCPFHGNLNTKRKMFVGKVVSSKMNKSVVVEWELRRFVRKYERYEKRRTKVSAHNPPCIDAKEGDIVKIVEVRPLSKTKNFVVVQVIDQK